MKKNKRLVFEILLNDGNVLKVDKNLINAEFGALDRGDIKSVDDWGIYANRGSFSFVDNEKFFNNENINSASVKKSKVKIYIAKGERENLLATFSTEDCNFEDTTRVVEFQLVSGLVHWQNKKTTQNLYPHFETKAADLLNLLAQQFGVSIGSNISSGLSKISIPCPYIEASNLWNMSSEICKATMNRVIEAADGSAIIANPYPSKKPIIVKPKNIIGYDVQGFVKIPNVSIDYTVIKEYNGDVTDETTKSFVINWDKDGKPTSADGISLSFDTKSYGNQTASGSYIIDTNHKIWGIADKKDYFDQKTISHNEQTSETFGLVYTFFESASVPKKGEGKIILHATNASIGYKDPDYFTITPRVETKLSIYGFDDEETKEELIISEEDSKDELYKIQTSSLVRENSYYFKDSSTKIPLKNHIMSDVIKRYGRGIECFEIECMFNDYYYDDGSVAFDGVDMSKHFEKYDLIEPYTVRGGEVVPLRKNEDGKAKQFRIMGISYTYDGFLKQKLYVQEERYDED